MQAVLVAPVYIFRGLREGESALDDLAGRDVELAHDVGIGAARAQRDEAARIFGREAVGPVPHPTLALLLPQSVDIDQHPPFGFARDVGFEGGDPPQPAWVLRVAPPVARKGGV